MADSENDAIRFTMDGARQVLALFPGVVHFEQQILTIERAIADNPALAFDMAKSLIETTCKTILNDRGRAVEEKPDLPKLVKETVNALHLVPLGHSTKREATASVKKTLGGLKTVVYGICELRSHEGFAHGRDAYSRSLETVQALLAARAADAVVSFLFAAHKSYPEKSIQARLRYEDNGDFNQYVDEGNEEVAIFDLKYNPSDVLFHVDEVAYRELLTGFLSQGSRQQDPPAPEIAAPNDEPASDESS